MRWPPSRSLRRPRPTESPHKPKTWHTDRIFSVLVMICNGLVEMFPRGLYPSLGLRRNLYIARARTQLPS
jgi:hypothetical protein